MSRSSEGDIWHNQVVSRARPEPSFFVLSHVRAAQLSSLAAAEAR